MAENERVKTVFIPLDKLKPDPANVRSEPDIDPELQDNLKKGQIEPIIVRPDVDTDKYLVTVGSRRVKAAEEAGLEGLEAKIREDLKGKDYEALQLSARENAGNLEVPDRDWREAVRKCLEKESIKEEKKDKVAQKIADRLGLSKTTVENHIEVLRLPKKYEWILGVADGNPPTVVNALRKKSSNRTKAEKEAIREKFEKESDEVPCIAEASDVLSPKSGLGSDTMGHESMVGLARKLDRLKELPFQEQVIVVLETLKKGQRGILRALERAEDRLKEKERKRKRRSPGGYKVTFRLNEEYHQLLKDYANSVNVTVPDQAAENLVMRYLDNEVRGQPRLTSIR